MCIRASEVLHDILLVYPARSRGATRAIHGVRRPFGEFDPISSWSPLIHVVGGSAGNNWICGSRRKCFSSGYVALIYGARH